MNFKHGQSARKGLETVMGDLVHLGYGNLIMWRRVVGIFPVFDPAGRRWQGEDFDTGRRLRAEAEGTGRLLNLASGHRVRSVILTDSNHVILAAKDVAAVWRQVEIRRQ